MIKKELGPGGSPDLSVTIAGIKFRNPVIAASGTFGYGLEGIYEGEGVCPGVSAGTRYRCQIRGIRRKFHHKGFVWGSPAHLARHGGGGFGIKTKGHAPGFDVGAGYIEFDHINARGIKEPGALNIFLNRRA